MRLVITLTLLAISLPAVLGQSLLGILLGAVGVGSNTGPITITSKRPTGPEPICPICRAVDKFPSNANEIIRIRYFGDNTCAELFDLGLNGDIPEFLCGVTQDFSQGPCGCANARPVTFVGGPPPAPAPAPAPAPTPPTGGSTNTALFNILVAIFQALFGL